MRAISNVEIRTLRLIPKPCQKRDARASLVIVLFCSAFFLGAEGALPHNVDGEGARRATEMPELPDTRNSLPGFVVSRRPRSSVREGHEVRRANKKAELMDQKLGSL